GRLDRLLVHEHAVQGPHAPVVAVQSRIRIGRGLLDDGPHPLLGQIPQGVEGAVARTVRRDLVRAQPAPVHMAEQVVLQADGRVDLLEREAGGYSGSGGHRRLLGVGAVRCESGAGQGVMVARPRTARARVISARAKGAWAQGEAERSAGARRWRTRVDNPEATDSTKVPIASTGVRITSTVAPTWKVIEPSTSSRRIRTVERALTRSASIVATVRSAHSEGRFRRRRVATVCAVARAIHTRAAPAPIHTPSSPRRSVG